MRLALVAGSSAGASTDGISGSANWSVPAAEPGATITLAGAYQNGAPGPVTYVIQLSSAGGGNGLITSFTNSAKLTGCTPTNGTIVTCTWNATAQNESAAISATVVVPFRPVGQEWQDARWDNVLLGTDTFEVIAPGPTDPATTTTATIPVPTDSAETPTTVEATTTTAAASGGGTGTTQPRSTALPATGSPSSGPVMASILSLLAGILVVTAPRRRPLP